MDLVKADLTHVHSRRLFTAATTLMVFMPSHVPHQPWLDDWQYVWGWVDHCPSWDNIWFTIFARAAKHAVQTPEQWLPRLPMLFSRLLDSFALPVGSKRAPPSSRLPRQASLLMPSSSFSSSLDKKAKLFV